MRTRYVAILLFAGLTVAAVDNGVTEELQALAFPMIVPSLDSALECISLWPVAGWDSPEPIEAIVNEETNPLGLQCCIQGVPPPNSDVVCARSGFNSVQAQRIESGGSCGSWNLATATVRSPANGGGCEILPPDPASLMYCCPSNFTLQFPTQPYTQPVSGTSTCNVWPWQFQQYQAQLDPEYETGECCIGYNPDSELQCVDGSEVVGSAVEPDNAIYGTANGGCPLTWHLGYEIVNSEMVPDALCDVLQDITFQGACCPPDTWLYADTVEEIQIINPDIDCDLCPTEREWELWVEDALSDEGTGGAGGAGGTGSTGTTSSSGSWGGTGGTGTTSSSGSWGGTGGTDTTSSSGSWGGTGGTGTTSSSGSWGGTGGTGTTSSSGGMGAMWGMPVP